MPLDGITANALALELNEILKDARVDRIYQPDRFDLVLYFRTPEGQQRLLLSANPAAPRLHVTTQSSINPAQPPMFCMLLRKHLIGARLLSVTTPGYERIFNFRFATVNELGDTVEKRLVAEMMGRHSNIIFLNDDDRIHDSILHVDQDMSRVREIMPARTYTLPPAQYKLTPEDLLNRVQNDLFWLGDSAAQLEKAILSNCQGFSPQLSQEICLIAGLDSRIRTEHLSADDRKRLNRALKCVLTLVIERKYCPGVFLRSADDPLPVDFHCLNLSIYAFQRQTRRISEAMDLYYLEKSRQNTIRQKRQHLAKVVQNQLEHARKKYQIHLAERTEGEKFRQYQLYGELILSNFQQVEKALRQGITLVQCTNYNDPALEPIEISLQPNRSAAWNAQNYFRRYNKARTKLENAERLAHQDQLDIIWLESLAGALDNANEPEDLIMIRREIASAGLIAPEDTDDETSATVSPKSNSLHDQKNQLNPGKPGRSTKNRHKALKKKKNSTRQSRADGRQPAEIAPRRYYSDDGFEILAGRNNLQNDQLTLRTASKDDLWLHVQKMSGTHVIIRRRQKQIPERTLLQAAGIAAWYSRAGVAGGAKTAVDYCLVRHVKKPGGGRPGMVVYEQYQTLLVEPLDPASLDKNKFISGANSILSPDDSAQPDP